MAITAARRPLGGLALAVRDSAAYLETGIRIFMRTGALRSRREIDEWLDELISAVATVTLDGEVLTGRLIAERVPALVPILRRKIAASVLRALRTGEEPESVSFDLSFKLREG